MKKLIVMFIVMLTTIVSVSNIQAAGDFVGGGQTIITYDAKNASQSTGADGKYEIVGSATIKKVPQTGIQISEKQTSEFFAISLGLLIILLILYRKARKQDDLEQIKG